MIPSRVQLLDPTTSKEGILVFVATFMSRFFGFAETENNFHEEKTQPHKNVQYGHFYALPGAQISEESFRLFSRRVLLPHNQLRLDRLNRKLNRDSHSLTTPI